MIDPANALITYKSTEDALREEQGLFKHVTSGSSNSSCFIWTANRCLVVPQRFRQNKYFASACQTSEASGWPVQVRQTGGGATPQGPGVLNVSLSVANTTGANLSIADGYALICNPIIAELNLLGINAYCASVSGAFCDGAYNVVVRRKKLVGTAQRRARLKGQSCGEAIFAHALILYEADLHEITQAVNRLYSSLRQDQRFESAALCNFTSLGREDHGISAKLLGRRLLRRYQAELNILDSRRPDAQNNEVLTTMSASAVKTCSVGVL